MFAVKDLIGSKGGFQNGFEANSLLVLRDIQIVDTKGTSHTIEIIINAIYGKAFRIDNIAPS